MKAVTIYQPYAELIARGEKRVENRSWRTDYRGPLAIHAGCSRAWLRSWPRPFSPPPSACAAIGNPSDSPAGVNSMLHLQH